MAENEEPEIDMSEWGLEDDDASDIKDKAAADNKIAVDPNEDIDMAAWGLEADDMPAESTPEVKEEAPKPSGGQSKAEMDQTDIDKLMGIDSSYVRTFDTVIENMIYAAMLNYEKLPMLDVIFDRFVLTLTTALKTHTSANTDVTLSSLEYMSYSKAMASLPMPGILTVCSASPWNGRLVVGCDAPFLYSALEIMLGGRKAKPARPEGRSFTSIERKIAAKLTEVALTEMKEAFAPLTDVDFKINSVETNPQFATVAQPSSPAVHAKMKVVTEGRKGQMDMIIPYATIEPVRKLLSKVFFGERLGGDPQWEEHLQEEVSDSKVELSAMYTEMETTLHKIRNWKIGDTIDLNIMSDNLATISCGDIPMFEGTIGKTRANMKALKITNDLGSSGGLFDDLSFG